MTRGKEMYQLAMTEMKVVSADESRGLFYVLYTLAGESE